jgi:hypothetical protein
VKCNQQENAQVTPQLDKTIVFDTKISKITIFKTQVLCIINRRP